MKWAAIEQIATGKVWIAYTCDCGITANLTGFIPHGQPNAERTTEANKENFRLVAPAKQGFDKVEGKINAPVPSARGAL